MPNKEKKQNIIRILSLPVDDGGCGWYRVRQPFNMILKNTDHDAYVTDKDDDGMEIFKALKVADIVVIRQGAEEGMRRLVEKYPEIRAKWVMDIDDNIEIISPYSEHYTKYGTKEYYDRHLKNWLWKDGVGAFDSKRNSIQVASLIEGMREVDMITATTERLADYASKYNKNVKVLPNCIDHSMWWNLNLRKNKQLRVGWSGGVSHYEDWYAIRKPLNELMKEYDFKLIMVGSHYAGLIDEDNKDRVEVHPWVPFKGHSYRMMCLGLDVAIVPLADLPFNKNKSPVKWFEMSAMGVPSIVSDVQPYKGVFMEGETALGYRTPRQFKKALKTLLTKPKLRKNIGYASRKWVEKNRDAKKCASMWIEAYQSLL